MSTNLNLDLQQEGTTLLARLERLPLSRWQVNLRLSIGTATFFDAFDALMIAYIMPILIPKWGISPLAIGPLLAISYVGQILGAIIFGWLSEKVGRRASLIGAILIMGIMSLVCAFSWNYYSLLIFRFIQGLGLGGQVPVAATYVNEWSKAKGRGPFVVLYESVFSLGLIGAALLGLVLIPVFGWQSMFIFGAIPALIVPLFIKKLPESPRWLINHGRLDEAELAIRKVENELIEKYKKNLPPIEIKLNSVDQKNTKWTELFQGIYRKRTLTVWVLWFSLYFILYGMQTWLPTMYTNVFHLPLQQSLLYSVSVNVATFLAYIVVAAVIDKIGRKPLFIISLLGLAIVCFLLLLSGVQSATTLWIYTMISGVFLTMAGVLYLYTPELYPTRLRGIGTSVATSWLRIASAIGPTIVGFVVAKYSVGAMFGIFGVIALLGTIVTALFADESSNKVLEEISP